MSTGRTVLSLSQEHKMTPKKFAPCHIAPDERAIVGGNFGHRELERLVDDLAEATGASRR
jgi:hypothetical protein